MLNVNSPGRTVDLISNNLIVSSFTCEMEKIIKRLTEESTDAFTHTNCVWKKKKKNSGDIKGGCFSLNILLGEFYAF